VSAVPARLHEVARTFRMSKIDSALKVFAPAAAASILVGLRLAMSLSLILAIAAEMIGNPAGLGYALVREAQALHPDAMFGYVALIGALGILLNGVLVALAKLALPGEFRRPSHSGSGPA
jgi:sulfonate transport system permease protein